MKNIIPNILLFIPFLVHGQVNAIFNKMDFNYSGDVESVMIETFVPRTKDKKSKEFRYDGGLLSDGSQKIFFDEKGKVIKKYEYETTCGGDSIYIDAIWKYYYTESRIDSVIRSKTDTSLIRIGFRPWKFFYHYESDSVSYATYEMSFNSTRRIIKRHNQQINEYLKKDSIVYHTEISTYDTLGRIVKFEIFRNNILSEITLFHFSDAASKTAHGIYQINLSENQVSRTENELNSHGDIIKTTLYRPDGTYMTHWSLQYEYDKMGNWIKKEKYNYEEKLLNIYKQTIQYRSGQ